MDPNQELAKKLISNGHNLVLTGQGGTGKTYTIQSCYDQLKNFKKTRATYLLHRDCMQTVSFVCGCYNVTQILWFRGRAPQ
jgi:DNA replication protein DnaC